MYEGNLTLGCNPIVSKLVCIAGAEEVEKCPSLVKGHMAHGLVATITTTGKTGEKKKYYVVEVMEPSRPQLLAFCLSVLIFQSFSRLNL